jgi:hypothetical protein
MSLPWVAGRVLEDEERRSYFQEVRAACGHCNFRPYVFPGVLTDFPLLMKPGVWPKLARLAEKLTTEALAAEREILNRPDLMTKLGLPASLRTALQGCARERWPQGAARVMRFDFYFTTKGWRFSEVNADSPGGYLDANGFIAPMAPYYPGYAPPPNPAAVYAAAIRKATGKDASIVVLREGRNRWADCQAQFVAKEIRHLGMRGIIAEPQELRWNSGRAHLAGSGRTGEASLLVRFYLGKWLRSRHRGIVWEPWFSGGKTPMSNPGTAVLIESKRFPLTWGELESAMPSWHSFLPETRCPKEIRVSELKDWVLKPSLGSMGLRVAIAGVTEKRRFERFAALARGNPSGWVAQRRFTSVPVATERGPGHVCIGVFTVDGVTAGAFGRIRGKPLIDGRSLGIPVLISESDVGAWADARGKQR